MGAIFSSTGVAGLNREDTTMHAPQEKGGNMEKPIRNTAHNANINNRGPSKEPANTMTPLIGSQSMSLLNHAHPKKHTEEGGEKMRKQKMPTPKEKKKQKIKQEQLEYAQERKTLIIMESGIRTINIASLIPDSMEAAQTQRGIIKNLNMNKIHIAAVHEARITQDGNYILDKYRFSTSSASERKTTGVVQGGTAVMIREIKHRCVAQISRRSSRVLRETIDRKNSKMPIQTLSTDQPRIVHKEDRLHHWKDVNEITNKTCNRHMTIWCADANGQLFRDE